MAFLFSVGVGRGPTSVGSPQSSLPVSRFDISNNNIVVIATDISLLEVDTNSTNHGNRFKSTGKTASTVLIGTDPSANNDASKPPITKNAEFVQEDEEMPFITPMEHIADETEVPWSQIFIYDLDRPWRPFRVFEFSGRVSVLKWSPCGNRILICSDRGMFYVLASKNMALNWWQCIHRGSLFTSSEEFVVHAAFIKPAIKFSLFTPPQLPVDDIFNVQEKPRIVAVPLFGCNPADGFFIVSNEGQIIFVVFPDENNHAKRPKYSKYSAKIANSSGNYSLIDSMFDAEEDRFYLTLGEENSRDIICVKIGLSFEKGQFSVALENLAALSSKNEISNIIWLKSGNVKERFVILTTTSLSGNAFEIWELRSDFFVALNNEIAESSTLLQKSSWNLMVEQPLKDGILCWNQPPSRFFMPELEKSATIAACFSNGEIVLYKINLNIEIAFSESVTISLLPPSNRTIVSLNFSGNGCLLCAMDDFCGISVFAISSIFSPLINKNDPIETLLATGCDFTDFCGSLTTISECETQLSRLEAVYLEMPISTKRASNSQYFRLKAGLVEKIHGKEVGLVVWKTVFFDGFLSYLEQFMAPEDPVLNSVFQITELQSILQRADVSLDRAVNVVERQVALDKSAVYQLQTGFHHVLTEMADFIAICARNPHVLPLTSDATLKIRLILVILSSWMGNYSFLKQLWQRPAFHASNFFNIVEVLFDVSKYLMSFSSDENWQIAVQNVLDEVNFELDNFGRVWSDLYFRAESRASVLGASQIPTHFKYEKRYSFLPSGKLDRRLLATDENDVNQDIPHRKPGRRKFCARCFFNFPWCPTSTYSGTWLSHMRHRWKTCFCGGAWILLE